MKKCIRSWCVVILSFVVFMSAAASFAALSDEEAVVLKRQVAELQTTVMRLQEQLERQSQKYRVIQDEVKPVPRPPYDPWGPFGEIDEIHGMMNQMIAGQARPQGLFGGLASAQQGLLQEDYDMEELDDVYVVRFDVPGMDESKISVELRQGMLIVSGEQSMDTQETGVNNSYHHQKSFGSFMRSIPMPEDARSGGIEVKYENDFLTIEVGRQK